VEELGSRNMVHTCGRFFHCRNIIVPESTFPGQGMWHHSKFLATCPGLKGRALSTGNIRNLVPNLTVITKVKVSVQESKSLDDTLVLILKPEAKGQTNQGSAYKDRTT